MAPNDTTYKWWSCYSGYNLLCKLCRTLPPPEVGRTLRFFCKLAIRNRWMNGTAPHKEPTPHLRHSHHRTDTRPTLPMFPHDW